MWSNTTMSSPSNNWSFYDAVQIWLFMTDGNINSSISCQCRAMSARINGKWPLTQSVCLWDTDAVQDPAASHNQHQLTHTVSAVDKINPNASISSPKYTGFKHELETRSNKSTTGFLPGASITFMPVKSSSANVRHTVRKYKISLQAVQGIQAYTSQNGTTILILKRVQGHCGKSNEGRVQNSRELSSRPPSFSRQAIAREILREKVPLGWHCVFNFKLV